MINNILLLFWKSFLLQEPFKGSWKPLRVPNHPLKTKGPYHTLRTAILKYILKQIHGILTECIFPECHYLLIYFISKVTLLVKLTCCVRDNPQISGAWHSKCSFLTHSTIHCKSEVGTHAPSIFHLSLGGLCWILCVCSANKRRESPENHMGGYLRSHSSARTHILPITALEAGKCNLAVCSERNNRVWPRQTIFYKNNQLSF